MEEWRMCSVDGCERPIKARGMCQPHYRAALKGGMTREQRRKYVRGNGTCEHVDLDGSRCSRRSDADRLCRMHYERRRRGRPMDGPPLKAPKGAGSTNPAGYRVVTSDGRPMLEHRLVMEEILGRYLWPWESVHHRNGRRSDNRPENLELWVKGQPAGQRPEDIATWLWEHYPQIVEAARPARRLAVAK